MNSMRMRKKQCNRRWKNERKQYISNIKMEAEAEEAYKTAKKAEIEMKDDDELYLLHEAAYNAYSKLDKFLDDSREAILFASTHSKKSNNITIVSTIITVISIIITVIVLFA